MALPTDLNPHFLASSGGYQIQRSLRFNSADSAYLNRTPASASNRNTWTWSGWVKRGTIVDTGIFGVGTSGSNYFNIRFQPDYISVVSEAPSLDIELRTTALYRDPSAWYHIVFALDTTQATANNRAKLYVNGTQVTAFSTANYPSQNLNLLVNSVVAHYLGQLGNSGTFFNGYLTEVNFIDGQALTPSSFGETDTATGVWKPKAYSGSYGTNGFYLKFADNSGTTSTTLGKDSSGNGNNWTPNNFSVTAGAGNDSLVDTPTPYGTDTGAGGEVRGNYATLNPLNQTGATLTNGNLQFTKSGAASSLYTIHPTFFVSSGKWYFEMTPTAINSAGSLVGIVGPDVALTTYASLASMTGNIWAWRQDSYKVNNGSSSLYGNTWTANDVIGIAIDMDNGKIWWSKNGTWQASGDPAAGTNAAFTNVSGSVGPLLIDQGITATFEGSINAGQRPFAYTAPSGFKALCTQNLPTPTIGATSATQAGKYFNTVLYTGNGTTQTISGVGFQPDLVWCKSRSNAYWHSLVDAVRTRAFALFTNDTSYAEFSSPSDKEVTAFTSDGFSLGPDFGYSINTNGATFVSFNWNAGGSTVTNTSGTITSSVRASTTAGFSIVTYTGNGSSSATVGHGLGTTPSMVIVRKRSAAANWFIKHSSVPGTQQLIFTDAAATNAGSFTSGGVGNLTSTTFGFLIGTDNVNNCNQSTATFVAYCFAAIAGYSAFGSYTGNGSNDGTFVYTGFRPRFVIYKSSGSSTNGAWRLADTARNTYNESTKVLYPNLADAESTEAATLDILSNGFKMRRADIGNQNGIEYIYIAFAENPFKYALAR